MSEEIDILKIVSQMLEKADIPYMLTGSLAANFYTIPRMTRDIVIEILKPDIDKFFQFFNNDFYINKESIEDAVKHQSMFNIIHNQSVLKVDFVIRKDTIYRNTEFKRRKRIQLGDMPIWIVSPEDLIISKLFWAKDSFSDTQLKDVKNLLSSINNLDEQYIIDWVSRLELSDIYAKVKK